MAEYLDDFHNVDEVFEFDGWPYLLGLWENKTYRFSKTL